MRFLLSIAALLVFTNGLYAQTFPLVVKNTPNGSAPLGIRLGSPYNSPTVTFQTNKKLVASSVITGPSIAGSNSTSTNYWYQVDLPGSSSFTTLVGYVGAGSTFTNPECLHQYVQVVFSTVNLRPTPGATTTWVQVNGQDGKVYSGQRFAVTDVQAVSGVNWYKIDLPDNCSQTFGWLASYAGTTQLLSVSTSSSNGLPTPTSVIAYNPTATGVSMSWNMPYYPSGSALNTLFGVYNSSGGFPLGTTYSPPTTLAFLNSCSTYTGVYVKAAADQCQSSNSSGVTFTTSCNCVNWNDNPPATLYDTAVQHLCNLGIISGQQSGVSMTGGAITRIEVARCLGKAFQLLTNNMNQTGLSFLDNYPNIFPALDGFTNVDDRRFLKLMLYLEHDNDISPGLGTDDIAPFSREFFYPNFSGDISRSNAIKAMLELWDFPPFMGNYDPSSGNYSPIVCDMQVSARNLGWVQRAAIMGLLTDFSTSCGTQAINFGADGAMSYGEFYVLLDRLLYNNIQTTVNYSDFFRPNLFYTNNLNMAVGVEKAVFHEFSDKHFEIPSGGPGLYFQHSYHSNLTEIPILNSEINVEDKFLRAKLQPLGGGWTHTYSSFIKTQNVDTVTPERVLIYWADGTVHSFLVGTNKYETKGITDVLTIDSFNSLNQPSKIRIRKGRAVFTFRNIDPVAYNVLSLVAVSDAYNNTLSLEYSNGTVPAGNGGFEPKLLSKVTDNFSGRSLIFNYANNYLQSVTDPIGRQIQFYVNPYLHDLDSCVNAKNQVTKYYYFATVGSYAYRTHLLSEIKKPNGNIILNSYINRKLKQSQSGNYKVQVNADSFPNYQISGTQQSTVTVIQNNQNLTTNFIFDANGNQLNANAPAKNISRQYDTLNRLTVERDLDQGYVTNYAYDANGFINKTILRDSVHSDSIKYEYVNNAYGEPTSIWDYNNEPNLSGEETTIIRNSNGSPTEIVKFPGSLVEISHKYTYASNGLLASYMSPANFVHQYEYNSYGNLRRVLKMPLSAPVFPLAETYTYDGVSRLIRNRKYNDDSSSFSYDNNDNLISAIVDPFGLGLTTGYSYDGNDNLIGVTSPKGHTTSLSYDFYTDLLREENDGIDKKRWRYNDDGSLDSFISKNSVVFKHAYSTQQGMTGLLTSDNYTFFQYLSTIKKPYFINNTWGKNNYFVYDKWNKPSIVNTNFFSSPDMVGYVYDRLQRVTIIGYPAWSGLSWSMTYRYNEYNRNLEEVKEMNSQRKFVTYNYTKDDLPLQEIYGNGDTVFYHYDHFNRLDSIWAKNKQDQVLYTLGASLDKIGRHTRENVRVYYQGQADTSAPTPQLAQSANYSYEPRNRIINGDGRTFSSDNAGNILSATNPSANCTWSVYGQLLSANNGSSNTTYEYDAIGFRKRKNNTYYVVDQERTGNVLIDASQASVPTNLYVHGNGLVARVDPVTDSAHYYHYDFRGSVIAITNEQGQIVQYYKYDDFGKVYKKGGNISWNNAYQYLGRHGVQTDDSDLYYMKARYYQPSTGRFISEDPVWNTNLFVYGEADPINNIDPSGESAKPTQRHYSAQPYYNAEVSVKVGVEAGSSESFFYAFSGVELINLQFAGTINGKPTFSLYYWKPGDPYRVSTSIRFGRFNYETTHLSTGDACLPGSYTTEFSIGKFYFNDNSLGIKREKARSIGPPIYKINASASIEAGLLLIPQ